MKQHVSLKDVARRADVSYQTVSKVLNDKGSVAPATRERIVDAARELGYVPNTLARGLVTRNTSLIGVVASDMSQTVLTQPLVGIEREARLKGYDVIIGSVSRSGDTSDQVIRMLLQRRVDGILLVAPQIQHDAHLVERLPSHLPIVSTHSVDGGDFSVVRTNELQVGIDATEHLLALGHTRIGTIVGDYRRNVSQLRLEGYRRALEGAGYPFEPAFVDEGGWDVEDAYQATHRLLDRTPRPTALFVQNDNMAIGTLAAIHDRGLRVPPDCAVIGCDDIPVASRTIPPLTTFRVPFQEIGATAMRTLAARIAGHEPDQRETLMSAPLVYRSSTGHRPAESPVPDQASAPEPQLPVKP